MLPLWNCTTENLSCKNICNEHELNTNSPAITVATNRNTFQKKLSLDSQLKIACYHTYIPCTIRPKERETSKIHPYQKTEGISLFNRLCQFS